MSKTNNKEMNTFKLPRKLKKGLKKAMIRKYPNWKSNEIFIEGISTDRTLRKHGIPEYRNRFVNSSRMIQRACQ